MMYFFHKNKFGFTLLELMVTVSIIGLLSAILMSSLTAARLKARDSKIKQQVVQLRNLLETDFQENNSSYANLQVGQIVNTAGCTSAAFAGNYITKVREICNSIISNSVVPGWVAYPLYIGNSVSTVNKYSIAAYLPGEQTFFCMGSGGKNSDDTVVGNAWTQPGCPSNP